MIRHIKLWFLTPLLLGMLVLRPSLALSANAAPQGQEFSHLAGRLIADGFNANKISRLYGSGKVVFDLTGMRLFFTLKESTLNYRQFLSPKNIRAARGYLLAHRRAFAEAEKKFGVDRHVIAAILLVETRLGRVLGTRSILDTLSSMAALREPAKRKLLWAAVSRHHWVSRKGFELKVNRRSAWAYRELSDFLTFSFREHLDPRRAKGSFAGAMGLCQFMPSNVLAYGEDGNGDGIVNPYVPADAIASIANYLKHFGWHPGIDKKAAYKVLLHYNLSSYYATTVLRVANKLKG
jgi:membrane-bound lytic murein transglycosylase B